MHRYSADQWADWIEQQRETGLSVVEFCDEVGVTTNSFYRWRAKLNEADARPLATSDLASAFVPLSVVGSAGIEIDFPCGAVARMLADEVTLRCVLRTLMDGTDRDELATGGAAC